MEVRSVSITKPLKPDARLAEAVVTLTDSAGTEEIIISDCRILRNKNEQLWVSLPTRAIKDGRNWSYQHVVQASRRLRLEIEDAVLSAYEKWERQQTEGGE